MRIFVLFIILFMWGVPVSAQPAPELSRPGRPDAEPSANTFEEIGVASLAPEVAKKLFDQVEKHLGGLLKAKKTGRGFTILVLCPGDADGKVPTDYAPSCNAVHAKLIEEFSNCAKPLGLSVVQKGDVAGHFGPVAPGPRLSFGNAAGTAAVMADINKLGRRVDAIVQSRLEVLPLTDEKPGYRLRGEVVFSDAKPCEPVTKEVRPEQTIKKRDDVWGGTPFISGDKPVAPGVLASRVNDKFLVQLVTTEPPNKQADLPILADPDTKILYVEVPNNLAPGTGYEVRITNRNTEPSGVGYFNPNEASRPYLVVLTVDGISSVYDTRPDNTYGLTAGEPFALRKWFLANPGWLLQRNDATGMMSAVPVRGEVVDHSRRAIPGFIDPKEVQDNGTGVKYPFVFGTPRDAAAANMGVNAQPGLIEVTIYAAVQPGDYFLAPQAVQKQQTVATTGPGGTTTQIVTVPGKPIPYPVVVGNAPALYPQPAGVWRIVYREAGDKTVPWGRLKPLDKKAAPVAAPKDR